VKQQAHLTLLCQSNAELAATYQLAQEFAMLLRGRKEEELSGWLKKVSESTIAELISFAKGLVRDEAAVRLPWNQGPVEGAVNRLKLIKREPGTGERSSICCAYVSSVQPDACKSQDAAVQPRST